MRAYECDQDSKMTGSPPPMILPEELCSWRTQLQDATDQALALIQGRGSRWKVQLTDPKRSTEGEWKRQFEHGTQLSKHTLKPQPSLYTHTETSCTPRTELLWAPLLWCDQQAPPPPPWGASRPNGVSSPACRWPVWVQSTFLGVQWSSGRCDDNRALLRLWRPPWSWPGSWRENHTHKYYKHNISDSCLVHLWFPMQTNSMEQINKLNKKYSAAFITHEKTLTTNGTTKIYACFNNLENLNFWNLILWVLCEYSIWERSSMYSIQDSRIKNSHLY